MNLIEKIIESKISRYGIWTLAVVIILSISVLSLITDKIDFAKETGLKIDGLLKGIILLIGLIFLVQILLWIWGDILFQAYWWFRLKFCGEKIVTIPDVSKWVYQGSLRIKDDLEITSSNSGALIRNPKFKNLRVKLGIEILNGGGVGIVFRGQDLENYLMLQIGIKDNSNYLTITPHVRFLGNFETFNIDLREAYYATKLTCRGVGDPLIINLRVQNNEAILSISKVNQPSEHDGFIWKIPTHVEANVIQRPNKELRQLEDNQFTSRIWFRNKHGMFGFRAYGLEKARIYDLDIEEI